MTLSLELEVAAVLLRGEAAVHAAALLAAWVTVELRVSESMVDIGMMRDRAVIAEALGR